MFELYVGTPKLNKFYPLIPKRRVKNAHLRLEANCLSSETSSRMSCPKIALCKESMNGAESRVFLFPRSPTSLLFSKKQRGSMGYT